MPGGAGDLTACPVGESAEGAEESEKGDNENGSPVFSDEGHVAIRCPVDLRWRTDSVVSRFLIECR